MLVRVLTTEAFCPMSTAVVLRGSWHLMYARQGADHRGVFMSDPEAVVLRGSWSSMYARQGADHRGVFCPIRCLWLLCIVDHDVCSAGRWPQRRLLSDVRLLCFVDHGR